MSDATIPPPLRLTVGVFAIGALVRLRFYRPAMASGADCAGPGPTPLAPRSGAG